MDQGPVVSFQNPVLGAMVVQALWGQDRSPWGSPSACSRHPCLQTSFASSREALSQQPVESVAPQSLGLTACMSGGLILDHFGLGMERETVKLRKG